MFLSRSRASFSVILNKVLLIVIILVELGILGGVIYWKFFSK